MARRCKTADFEKLITDARKHIPDFNVTTDIIVGFPGESDQEFQQSLDYIEKIGFGHIHIFSYSAREGTKAARLPNHIDKETKKLRSQQLHALADKLKTDAMQQQIGQRVAVMWERSSQQLANGQTRFIGHTPNYHRIYVDLPSQYNIGNRVIDTEIIAVDDASLVGAISVSDDYKTGAQLNIAVEH
jgi:threonylcarbamoyladenosine tRNA methylthiotransferase MtaB